MVHPDKSLIRPFRAEDWWRSKAALLMGFVYLFALLFAIPLKSFIPLSFFSVIVIIGFATFGYLVNDFFDKGKDELAGKKNFLLDKSPAYQLGFLLLTSIFIVLPWLYLPATTYSYILIAIQITLFLVYSAPPFRLKERGATGIVADALYAHGLPVLLAAYTFLLASGRNIPGLTIAFLFCWQFAAGLRNILIHQSEDIDEDFRSQTRNYSASMSPKMLNRFLFSSICMELTFCMLFFISAAIDKKEVVVCLLSVVGYTGLAFSKFGIDIKKMLYSSWRYFPNMLYEKWLPPIYLLLLTLHNSYFAVILLVHLALFDIDFYRRQIHTVYLFMRWFHPHIATPIYDFSRKYVSLFINYSIYYVLLVLGINLRQENTSALGYFKKHCRKK